MKILIAPNAFKGTIEADEASEIIAQTVTKINQNAIVEMSPIADGGDGTCYLLANSLGLERVDCWVLDAIGRPIQGFYFLDRKNKTAYLDVSTASGIKHLKDVEKSPFISSTYGTGELILDSLKHGVEQVVLGLGGSASIDLGLGILVALGFNFLDENGRHIPMFSENFLSKIRHIQRPITKTKLSFTCLCDVKNTFFGEKGAIPVFGPQKGLQQMEIPEYEAISKKVLDLMRNKTGIEIQEEEGFGAAGGIAYGLSYFFPVEMKMGARWFFEQVKMEEKIQWADWVITGEGQYDEQSTGGKGSFELLQMAKVHHKKTILITSGKGAEGSGFEEVIKLPDLDFSQQGFMLQARKNLEKSIMEHAHLFAD